LDAERQRVEQFAASGTDTVSSGIAAAHLPVGLSYVAAASRGERSQTFRMQAIETARCRAR